MNAKPTFAEVDLRAIAYNLKQIRQRVAPAQIMAVVKANAYGHGLERVVRVALENEVRYFGVARLEEGIELRQLLDNVPILVFGGFFKSQIEQLLEYDLEVTVFDLDRAQALSTVADELGRPARVHVKVDTGMGRIGVDWQQVGKFMARLQDLPGLEIVGIYTHFSNSDEQDKSYANAQIERFKKVIAKLEQDRIHVPIKHAANSGAVLNLPESYFDMVRPGVMMYGYYPSEQVSKSVALKPAMSLKSKVIAIKRVEAGTFISYNRTYQTSQRTNIATVAIGYGDGYNRLLSNRGEVLIHGRRYPIVGRVCMDQIMVNVGDDTEIQIGDEAVLWGRQGNEEITIYEICEKLETIPYEVTCRISERVPRVYK
ncbi:alanine racemase [candidate division KSB1 bacterium]|nr:alanine racemase [candidate division KSB1 bacterium]NIR69570.1 alanine racemase [candidate division KSB1 bacterium]NIS25918.1 alanine racemase [candidate division KSB1 bacterium]NIT72799.1 alanine racemase [candidate division KSB1 bacterium]NIU26606.1 alanine racemase [candidate division KSB1 bacterium]